MWFSSPPAFPATGLWGLVTAPVGSASTGLPIRRIIFSLLRLIRCHVFFLSMLLHILLQGAIRYISQKTLNIPFVHVHGRPAIRHRISHEGMLIVEVSHQFLVAYFLQVLLDIRRGGMIAAHVLPELRQAEDQQYAGCDRGGRYIFPPGPKLLRGGLRSAADGDHPAAQRVSAGRTGVRYP